MGEMKAKQRAIGIFLVLASILVLGAIWDLPGDWPAHR
jgi:hypothetical protein